MITPEQLAACGTEHGHQAAFFCWINLVGRRICPTLELAFAIPNGGQRGDGTKQGAKIAGGRLKAEGVKSGVPDIFFPQPHGNYSGLFIEMKRPKDKAKRMAAGRLADDQDEFNEKLRLQGYAVAVCFGYLEAVEAIVQYMRG